MAEITYRESIAVGLTQEMARDESVVLIGEDVGASGGVFKATAGLFERFGPRRVRDTPICEQAILGAAMGAAMTGLRPVAEIMFGDFLSVCHDLVANQIAKVRYMTAGQVSVPLVVRFGNGGGLHFGAQHSQSVESWLMAVPGLKVVVPSTPADVIGLMAAAVRDPDPVMVCEEKALYPLKGEIPEGEHVDELGSAVLRREGSDATIVAIGTMVHRALAAAEELAREGVAVEVVDLRSLVPLDVTTVAQSVARTARLFTVEENPRLCGWGAELASIIGEECFSDLDGPIRRITTPHVPLPAADSLEDAAIPSASRVAEAVRRGLG
ncbi:alpha-ketoacid dehydrogenase subunit beta [Mycobacterium sp.]|uniref:alpha-ketoacid dehydrogenase subunit beta n=1 Tax=Mycobacterium sp. TaxID=1785 RepID=UPI003F968060